MNNLKKKSKMGSLHCARFRWFHIVPWWDKNQYGWHSGGVDSLFGDTVNQWSITIAIVFFKWKTSL